jgi:hypothetical protein
MVFVTLVNGQWIHIGPVREDLGFRMGEGKLFYGVKINLVIQRFSH